MELAKNEQQQTTTTRLTRTCTRAGDAELILRTTQRQKAVIMVVCSRIPNGLLAASQADSWLLSLEQRQLLAPMVPLIPRHQWVRRHCRCFDRLPVAPSRAPLARCRWLRPRHLAREAPRLCLVETVLLSPEDVLLLREAHAAPPRSNR